MENLNLISLLGFTPKENTADVYRKDYSQGCFIEVDYDNKKINYDPSIKIGIQNIRNFTQAENWVVLECINRLLEKGYLAKNISLEKVYPSGHGTSGRLDILVCRDDGTAYLMIECKTVGVEFDKELKKIRKDGGQLFTYFQQDKNAEILLLYSSALSGKEVVYKNEIVKIEDDYRQTANVKDFFERWNKLTKDNGVFDIWVQPYNFESKALTTKQLVAIKQEDSSFIFNRFLEILRHNVVSDKGNAFNKIFTLFLCKVYDEKTSKLNEELKFQWLEGQDDDVSFQIRLTDLYKAGMKEFLEKEVTDFSESDFETEYKGLDEATRKSLLNKINKLRLEKNNEFAIKEVYDEKSFKENSKIVKEVVELLQGYRIRYNKRQQYLSDFFELLLTTGLKQESGQFFTPVPVAQYIIKSLPIDYFVNEKIEKGERNNLLPYIIDYAAGSGHFLTESMHEVQRLIDEKTPSDYISDTEKKLKAWQEDHFDWATNYVYGIEKDYRLVKVGKVGCYLHGDGLANVILSDGLANFNNKDYKDKLRSVDKDFPQENRQFDVLISNPPYSVSAFRNAARNYYTEDDFDLYDSLTDNSSEIETLFVERAKQLLKDGGVAGIILPSSILSNTGIYTKAREIILKYFEVIGITELGSNTFMATGTNTVVLFLRRRNNYDHINLQKAVEKFFTTHKDVTLNGVEKPVNKYLSHVWEGITFDDYVSLLKKEPNETIAEHEIYKEYLKKLKAKNEGAFWEQLLERESEKLFYFIIAYPQKVVLVKSGHKDEEKRFLGYEFSNRRGSEGIHPIQRGKTIAECTKLFDEDSFENEEKASTYIYRAFNGDFESEIHPELQKNVTRHALVDMLTFDRLGFEKNISLAVKKKVKIESKWDVVTLSSVIEIIGGGTPDTANPEYWNGDVPWLSVVDFNGESRFVTTTEKKITEKGLKNSSTKYLNAGDLIISARGTVGALAQLQIPMTFNQSCYGLRGNERVDNGFLYYILKSEVEQLKNGSYGTIFKAITTKTFDEIKIPLPPLDVQHKIVAEIEALEKREGIVKREVEDLRLKANNIIEALFTKNSFVEISEVGKVLGGKRMPKEVGFSTTKTNYPYIRVSDFKNGAIDLTTLKYIDEDVFSKIKNYTISKDDVYISIAGTIGLVGLVPNDLDGKSLTENAAKIVIEKDKITKEYLFYSLASKNLQKQIEDNTRSLGVPKLALKRIETLKIPLPSLSEQQKIVSEIEKIESKISVLEKEIAEMPKKKEAILKKYLN